MNYQKAIFNTDHKHFKYLEYSIQNGDFSALAKNILSDQEKSKAVIGFGKNLSVKLFSDKVPADFTELASLNYKKNMPSTQQDVFIWIHGDTIGDVFDRAREIDRLIPKSASLKLEKDGFIYHDSRDLSGFIDGSANPQGEKALAAAIIQDGPAIGGSIILTQQWNHKLDLFEAIPQTQQEKIIGRTKPDSIEFEGLDMPEDSHVAKNDISGTKIYRRSTPFGNLQEYGLYFLSFSCEQKRYDTLLKSMAGEKGSYDRIMDYSTAVSGSYFYCPSTDLLASL